MSDFKDWYTIVLLICLSNQMNLVKCECIFICYIIIHDRGNELKHLINSIRGTTALVSIASVTIECVFAFVFIHVWRNDTWSKYPIA